MSKKPNTAKKATATPTVRVSLQAAPDGGTVITFLDTKREIRVPKGITIQEPPHTFGDEVAHDVDAFMEAPGPHARHHIWLAQGAFRLWSMDVRKVGRQIGVRVYDRDHDDRTALWALFRQDEGGWVERLALSRPEYRGRGLYSWALKMLKRDYRTAVYSDRRLSPLNAASWDRRGTFDPRKRRYRLNPPMTPAMARSAVRLAFIEAYVKERLS